jgi:hypothetical protein
MALFNLTDIAYKKLQTDNRSFAGFSNGLSNYNPNLLRYPADLGNTDKGHYMMIHVHVQDKTSYVSNLDRNDPKSAIQKSRESLRAQTGATNLGGAGKMITDKLTGLFGETDTSGSAGRAGLLDPNIGEGIVSNLPAQFSSTLVDPIKTIIDNASDVLKGINSALRTMDGTTFLRTTKRTTDSIALYMPDTLAFTDNQTYNQLELGGELLSLGAAGASILADAASGDKFDAQSLGKNLSPFIGDFIANKLSGILGPNSTRAAVATLFGAVKNPQLELIYSSPEFRSFAFEFMFYPRSEKEAQEVQKIVQRLRFHQAPEILTGSAGYFMVPPSEFDIEFYYNGQVNPNIPKISTCALTSISIDYAPNGFRAYEVPGQNSPTMGATGMPVGMRVNLSFRELEIMTKFNYQDETNRRKV